MILSKEIASDIYDILVEECGAPESMRDSWMHHQTSEEHTYEWRFSGHLGFGGKFWRNMGRWYVDCYLEDSSPKAKRVIKKANAMLADLRETYEIPHGED
jgi:hypothetical protein